MEFKLGQTVPMILLQHILIESQWNLNEIKRFLKESSSSHINRITVEFKFISLNCCSDTVQILIESQWNLNTGPIRLKSRIKKILIESQWNLNVLKMINTLIGRLNINRITVEFKCK